MSLLYQPPLPVILLYFLLTTSHHLTCYYLPDAHFALPPAWAEAEVCTSAAPQGPAAGHRCAQPEAAPVLTEGSSPKATVSWNCAMSLLCWCGNERITHTHTHMQRHLLPAHPRVLDQSYLVLPNSSQASGETSLSVFTPRSRGVPRGRDYSGVGWNAWLNQKFWI